jgi:hypothetical protein
VVAVVVVVVLLLLMLGKERATSRQLTWCAK